MSTTENQTGNGAGQGSGKGVGNNNVVKLFEFNNIQHTHIEQRAESSSHTNVNIALGAAAVAATAFGVYQLTRGDTSSAEQSPSSIGSTRTDISNLPGEHEARIITGAVSSVTGRQVIRASETTATTSQMSVMPTGGVPPASSRRERLQAHRAMLEEARRSRNG